MPSRKPFQDIANLNIKSTNREKPDCKNAKSRNKTKTCNFSFQDLRISTHRYPHSEFLLVHLKVTTSLPNIIHLLVKILERKKYKTVWIIMNEKLVNDLFEKFFGPKFNNGKFNRDQKCYDNENTDKFKHSKSNYDEEIDYKHGSGIDISAHRYKNHIFDCDEKSTSHMRRPFRSILTLPSIFAPLYTLPGYQTHFEYQHMVTGYGQNEILMYRMEKLEKEK